ncbi:MAG: mandelate racemase/muconate lactonizing enzyme family protein [Chloroflexi bacterium]|nr:mandelate racemase/muconate lactonizing enzyme family protein [Chloroflexota bacterium]
MPIERVEAIPFRIPIKAEIGPIESNIWAMDAAEHVLVKITDADGVVGWGEATPRVTIYGDTQASTVAAIREWIGPALVGLEPYAVEAAWQRMDRLMHNLPAKAAVDMALHDLLGKRLGVSVVQLLGGMARDRAPLGTIIPLGPPENVADIAVQAVERGVQTLKIKVGKDPDRDVRAFRAIRRAVGERATLAIDVNQGYSVPVAIRVLRALGEDGLAWAEEPVKAWDAAGKLKVAQAVGVPLLLDESVFTPQDVLREIRNGACGMVSIKTARSAFFRSRAIASICEAANVPCVLGSARESALGTVVSAHFAAAARCVVATELGDHVIYEATLLREPPCLANGCLVLPTGPGLGIEIDEAQVRRYRLD